jgi:hypothetical protein
LVEYIISNRIKIDGLMVPAFEQCVLSQCMLSKAS